VSGLFLDPDEGGKYSDISFLMKILGRSQIVWEYQPVMRYRKHSAQDSQGTMIKDALSLLNYILQNTDFTRRSKEVRYFRYKSWAGVLKGEFFSSSGRYSKGRRNKIFCAILKFSPLDIFLKLLIWRIWFFFKRLKRTARVASN